MIKPKNSNNSYYKLKQKFKKAFTLTEIIVATFISAIILSFVYVFLNNVIFTISDTKNDVKSLSSVYDFINKLNNYNNIYSS
ncbi:prepilin-type N-terminal cleavage/methylation domain-containing protein [bacterium]|jgi:prepilin-type N-terminal cleavage/methylation domain-containing protein|nr:prepilin-type N-terminal cleavage/methylation domain-containing protein [bacterium]